MRAPLIEAYEGFYEKELSHVSEDKRALGVASLIYAHTPKERLAVYLTWNGILGYTETIWAITQGYK